MGGSIWAESEVGRGSTSGFTIVAPAMSPVDRGDEGARAAILNDKRLLVVDDNATDRRIECALQTEPFGVHVRGAGSGAEALSILESGERFDAALLDVQMPGMDGVALAAEIRKKYPPETLPLLVFSSSAHYDHARTQPELGIAAVLMKPVRQVRMIDALVSVFSEGAGPRQARRRPLVWDPGLANRSVANPPRRGQRDQSAGRARDARAFRVPRGRRGEQPRRTSTLSSGRPTTSSSWTSTCLKWTASKRPAGSGRTPA